MTINMDTYRIPKIVLVDIAIILLLVMAFDPIVRNFVLFRPDSSRAVSENLAVDALGQTNLLIDGEPFYTSGEANDGGAMNGHHLSNPGGMDVAAYFAPDPDDAVEELFIADTGHNRVLAYTLDMSCGDGCGFNGIGEGYPNAVVGQPDFRSDSSGTSGTSLDGPNDVAVANGYLFVADTNNNRVLAFEMSGDTTNLVDTTADIVIGQTNFTGSAPGTSDTTLNGPQYLAYDSLLNLLYVTDSGNNRVLAYDLNSVATGMAASYVLGQVDFVSNGAATTQTGMNNPTGIAFLDNGYSYGPMLFVADTGNNRVLAYDARPEGSPPMSTVGYITALCDDDTTGIANGVIAACVLGQTDFITGTGGFDDAHFNSPSALAAGYHNLSVGSSVDNRILVFNFYSEVGDDDGITTGEPAVDVLGADTYGAFDQCGASDEAPCARSVNEVRGIRTYDFGSYGGIRILVSDATYDRVVEFDTAINGPTDVAAENAIGQYDIYDEYNSFAFLNTTSAVSSWGLDAPGQLALDVSSQLMYLADTNNNRVLQYTLNGMDQVNSRAAVRALGQGHEATSQFGVEWLSDGSVKQYEGPLRSNIANWANEDCDSGPCDTVGTPNGYNFSAPSGAVFANNYLFILDAANSRIQRYDTWFVGYGAADESVSVEASGNQQLAYDLTDSRLFVPSGEGADEITIYSNDLDIIGSLSAPLAGEVTGVVYDTTGNRLFASAGDCVFVYDFPEFIPVSNTTIPQGASPTQVLGDTNLDCSGGGGTSAAEMSQPEGLSYDPNDESLYVADTGNNRVLRFDVGMLTDGEDATGVTGQPDFTSGGAGTTRATLDAPTAVLYLPNADLLAISDTGNNRVMYFDPNGFYLPDVHIATDLVGQLDGSDLPIYTANEVDNGLSELSARFQSTTQIVLDEVGHRLFVGDSGNSRVLVFALDETNQLIDEMPDKVLGQPDFDTAGSSFPPTQASLTYAEGLAYNATDQLLFVSAGSRVTVFSVGSDIDDITDGMDATYVIGQTTFTSFAEALDARHIGAGSLAYDDAGHRLFVADAEDGHSRVMVFDVSLANLASEATGVGFATNAINVLGPADFTTFTGSGCTPSKFAAGFITSLVYDPSVGYLYVANPWGGRVMVFDVNAIANGESAISVLGEPSLSSCVGGTTQALMSWMHGMGIKQGSPKILYVSDNDRIMAFDIDVVTDGEPAVNVLGDSNFTGSEALNDSLGSLAYGIAYDTTNDALLVSDSTNSSIRFYDLLGIDNGESVAAVLGTSHRDVSSSGTSPEAETVANAKGLWEPHDVVVDGTNHRLFVADSINNRVLVYELTVENEFPDRIADYVLGQESMTTKLAGTRIDRMDHPTGIAYDESNSLLYVADHWNHRVLVYNLATIADGQDAAFVIGQAGFTNSVPATTQSGLSQPRDVSLDTANGILYVADAGNNRVLAYDVGTSGENLANALPADVVYGQTDFDTSTDGLSETQLTDPVGVLADTTNGVIWIADASNNRVVGYIPNDSAASYVLGQPSMYDNSPVVSQEGMTYPLDMTMNTTDNLLYVSDSMSNRVLVFDISDGVDAGEPSVDIYGQGVYDSDSSGTSDIELFSPGGLAFDTLTSTLWVADTDNNRVLAFGPGPATPGGGGGSQTPEEIGFFPDRITINDDDGEVEGYNVLVNIYAHFSEEFEGTVDVLLSNTPDFSTTIPFRYNIPDQTARKNWPKTVAWDLCFGLKKEECDLGRKDVYARFYVNLPSAEPAFTPITKPAK